MFIRSLIGIIAVSAGIAIAAMPATTVTPVPSPIATITLAPAKATPTAAPKPTVHKAHKKIIKPKAKK